MDRIQRILPISKFLPWTGLLLFILSTSGCASIHKSLDDYLEKIKLDRWEKRKNSIDRSLLAAASKTGCCSSYEQMEYEYLQPNKMYSYDHTRDLQTILTNSGKSFAKGVRIDAEGEFGQIFIESKIFGESENEHTFMNPSVLVLDKEYNVIRDLEWVAFESIEDFQNSKSRIIGLIKLDQLDGNKAQYIIIYFNETFRWNAAQKCIDPWTQIIFTPHPVPIFHDMKCYSVAGAPEGKLSLTFRNNIFKL